MDKLVLIDGHSILNRAFYGVPMLTNAEGLHTNAVYGFLNIMFKILEEEKADHLAVAFDMREPTFRHKMYPEYKGTRKGMPEELHEQVPLIQDILAAMGVPVMTLAGYEADDILGTLAGKNAANGVEVSVVSGDRDLLQLAGPHIKIRIPRTNKSGTEVKDYYPEDVLRDYGVTPQEFIDVKALMGDASDNIPGVPGIGEKTAVSLISAYHSIENAYAHLEEIRPPKAQNALREHYDMAQMSKKLATICTDCPIGFSYADMEIGNLYTPEAYRIMQRLELKSLLSRFDLSARTSSPAEERFVFVSDPEKAEEIFARAAAETESGLLGFALAADGEEVKGISLCFGENDCYVITAGETLTGSRLAGRLTDMILSAARAVTVGLKAQLPYLGIDYGSPAVDAEVAAYLLNPLKDAYDYDDIARDHLDMILPSRSDLLGKASIAATLEESGGAGGRCLGYLGYVALRSADVLREKLEETGMWDLFTDIEMPLIYSLRHMEAAGVRVEKDSLREYGKDLKAQIDCLQKEIYDLAGGEFNINSPRQLGEILFEKMELPHGKKTKTGYSTAADVLEKLAAEYPVVKKILDYRQLAKLYSTYAEGLSGYIREDGRIHGTFNQTITATGRISSTEPNLQNIPVRMEQGRRIRKVFVPEDGFVFVDADYSQIELRILAHMSGDERLIRAYGEAQDIHAITASQVFHIPLDQVTPLQRRNAKAVNFGIVYGISAFGLSEDLSISRKEAEQYIAGYFDTYPGVRRFLDEQVRLGKEQGYVTTMYGRRRPIPEMKDGNFMRRQFGERVAMNSPIQGTAADIMKIAMIAVDKELRDRNMRSRIVLQVHDELLVEAARDEADDVKRILEEKMRSAARLRVSLEVEVHMGDTWLDAK